MQSSAVSTSQSEVLTESKDPYSTAWPRTLQGILPSWMPHPLRLIPREFCEAAPDSCEYFVSWREEFSEYLPRSDQVLFR